MKSRVLACREVILHYQPEYLETTLRPEAVGGLEQRLAACTPCTAYLNAYKRTRDLVKQTAPPDMPQEMEAILRKFLLEQPAKNP